MRAMPGGKFREQTGSNLCSPPDSASGSDFHPTAYPRLTQRAISLLRPAVTTDKSFRRYLRRARVVVAALTRGKMALKLENVSLVDSLNERTHTNPSDSD